MGVYSNSKLKTFEQCKFKYKLRYIDKIIPEIEKSIEAHLGTCVHLALEWLYSTIQETGNVPELDDVITTYSKAWVKEYSDSIIITKKWMSAADYFNKGIKYLIDYYESNKPFQDNTIALEKEILVDLSDEHQLRGFIDRLVYNKETDEYEIHDYKTSETAPSEETIEKDTQLALYSLAIKDLFKHDKQVKMVWHFLSFNKEVELKKTNEQLAILKQATLDLINEIESTLEFPPTVSTLCNWCEYKEICPAWKESNANGNSSDRYNKRYGQQKL